MPVVDHPLTVLVVEDEADAACLLMEVLVEAGHRVLGPATSAATAALLVAQTGPDIALVDVRLEGEVSGVELARQLRTNWGVPTVFATGDSAHWTRDDGSDAPDAPIVLRKPYGSAEVLEALRRGARAAAL